MSLTNLFIRRRFHRGSSSPQFRRHFSGGSPQEEEDEGGLLLPQEWRRSAYPRLLKLSARLQNLDRADSNEVTTVGLISPMQEFKTLARAFIWSSPPSSSFEIPEKKRSFLSLRSLTNVCNLLEISAQQRRAVRLSIGPQITEHRIWRGAVEEVLRNLAAECQTLDHRRSPAAAMAEQIVSSCLRFMADAAATETPLWMQLSPAKRKKKDEEEEGKRSWGEVVEMVGHLSNCLSKEEKVASALEKVEAMKEGLYQIKDLLLEREIGYREARLQDSLVQKRLCKSLGHSSRCLFILLIFYLYGDDAGDLEIDLCGLSGGGLRRVDAGKILTSGDERVVKNAMGQLARVFGVLKLVWETAGMKEAIDLRGHIWWAGAEQRSLIYRGNKIFIHDFKL